MVFRTLVALGAALALGGCVTTKKDVSGSGDERFDDTFSPDKGPARGDADKAAPGCGPEGKGDVVLIDARSATPVACALVTLTRVPPDCQPGAECPNDVVFQGRANKAGQVLLRDPVGLGRLTAVVEGFAPSHRAAGAATPGKLVEIELVPDEGFWLKVLDAEGNYLQGELVTFKQGEEVLAQLRTNDLANVFFASRTPFAGDPVTVEATGYKQSVISGPADLGDDGHTVTLLK
ncbi:MAG: hypothetical protein ACYC8T_08385 [Myxococcaceae bacterium]